MRKEIAVRPTALLISLILYACLATFNSSDGTLASPLGQRGGDSVARCDVSAYVNDPDPKGMNVRSGPGATFKVVGKLPNQEVEGIVVHITGARGEWARIDLAVEEGGERERTLFKGEGWVYAPLLGVEGVGVIEGGTKIYQEPTKRSRVLGRMTAGGEGAVVRGCRGQWMLIEHRKVRGWAARGTLCSNSLTTCS